MNLRKLILGSLTSLFTDCDDLLSDLLDLVLGLRNRSGVLVGVVIGSNHCDNVVESLHQVLDNSFTPLLHLRKLNSRERSGRLLVFLRCLSNTVGLSLFNGTGLLVGLRAHMRTLLRHINSRLLLLLVCNLRLQPALARNGDIAASILWCGRDTVLVSQGVRKPAVEVTLLKVENTVLTIRNVLCEEVMEVVRLECQEDTTTVSQS